MHEFRRIDKEYYQGKTVMIVGSSISACDFIYHLLMSPWRADVNKCYLTGRSMEHIKKSSDYKAIVESGKLEFCDTNISEFKQGKKAILNDGTELKIDIVMYATGYEFNFPFLDKDDNIVEVEQEKSGGRFAFPLYKSMVSIREPNFNIIGLLSGSPIPLAGVDRQIMFSL